MTTIETDTQTNIGQKIIAKPRHKTLWRLVILVLLVSGAAVFWHKVLRHRFVAKNFGVVTAGKVYRSGQISKWMLEPTIKKHHIQVVVELNGRDLNQPHQTEEIETLKKLNIEHYRFSGLGGKGTGDINNYADAIEIINRCVKEGKPVLVHCAAGAQRTGGVIATYRMLVLKESPASAFAELPKYGWKYPKNKVLLTYVNSHMQELAELLVKKGVIKEVPQPLPVLGYSK